MALFTLLRRKFNDLFSESEHKTAHLNQKILYELEFLNEHITETHKNINQLHKEYQHFNKNNPEIKDIHSIRNVFVLSSRIHVAFFKIFETQKMTYENKKKFYEQNIPPGRKAKDIIDQLVNLVSEVDDFEKKVRDELRKHNSDFGKIDYIRIKNLEIKLEKLIQGLNKVHKLEEKEIKKIEELVHKIQKKTETTRLKKLNGEITEIEVHRGTKLRDLRLLQRVPLLQLEHVHLRSEFRFELHEDNDILSIMHYNLELKEKGINNRKHRNIHIIPKKYDNEFKKLIKQAA